MSVDQNVQYYYGEQIKKCITEFAQVFSEMYVTIGKNDLNSSSNYIRLPIIYGTQDRVVASIKARNTQNVPLRVPLFCITFESIRLNLDRMKGTNTQASRTVLPLGGDIKKDLKVVTRLSPLPYVFELKISSICSNSDQMMQVMEQILLLFDPTLQFQTSTTVFDWSKVIDAELTDINIEDQRGQESDGRLNIVNYTFSINAYLSPPADIKSNVIQNIMLRVEAVRNTENLNQYIKDSDRTTEPFQRVFDLESADIPSI